MPILSIIYKILNILILKLLADAEILNTNLSTCVRVYGCVYISVCLCIYLFIHTCIYRHIHIFRYTQIQVHTEQIHTHTHTHAYLDKSVFKISRLANSFSINIINIIQSYTFTYIFVCLRACVHIFMLMNVCVSRFPLSTDSNI